MSMRGLPKKRVVYVAMWLCVSVRVGVELLKSCRGAEMSKQNNFEPRASLILYCRELKTFLFLLVLDT